MSGNLEVHHNQVMISCIGGGHVLRHSVVSTVGGRPTGTPAPWPYDVYVLLVPTERVHRDMPEKGICKNTIEHLSPKKGVEEL